MGKWDNGILGMYCAIDLVLLMVVCGLDFGAAGECVELVDSKEYVGDPAFGTSTTQLHKVVYAIPALVYSALSGTN